MDVFFVFTSEVSRRRSIVKNKKAMHVSAAKMVHGNNDGVSHEFLQSGRWHAPCQYLGGIVMIVLLLALLNWYIGQYR